MYRATLLLRSHAGTAINMAALVESVSFPDWPPINVSNVKTIKSPKPPLFNGRFIIGSADRGSLRLLRMRNGY